MLVARILDVDAGVVEILVASCRIGGLSSFVSVVLPVFSTCMERVIAKPV